MTRKLTLLTILLALALSAVPAAAQAARVTVGLGDQSSDVFSDARFQALGLKRVRVITPWNVALSRGELSTVRFFPAASTRPVRSSRAWVKTGMISST